MAYIKKLVIHGFKSFPRKTEIPFTKGINIILGPNGSGKSNVSDALCFVLGRLSIKSMRAAKAGNLIFMGTKEASPAKEASVEIIFDNSDKTFSLDKNEIIIKRIVRRNGQSIYKIDNETKTRQEVLSLLAQAGIDPQGFNIILQGEIQSFVRMQPEDRRTVIEEVAGISVYESRKEKSLHELEKTEDRLKEISSILRERTSYLNNLEKERQQALRFKKLEADIKKFRASIIYFNLHKKRKENEKINSDIEQRNNEIEKIKKVIIGIETETKNFSFKIDNINSEIQKSTGLEQEKLNQEIANLRAELAGLNVKLENQESRLSNLLKQKEEFQKSLKESELSIKELQKESPTPERNAKEIEEKKKELEKLEEKRKKFYMIKSEINSVKERIEDKNSLLQNYTNESNFLIKQIESLSIQIFDKKANSEKLGRFKISLSEKKEFLNSLVKKEIELEKNSSINLSEIENQKRIIEKISKLDICPVCKSKITPKHMEEIKKEIIPHIESLKKTIESSDSELKTIYQKKEIIIKDIDELAQQISKTDTDLNKLSNINDKKNQIKILYEKLENLKKELAELTKKKTNLERIFETDSNIEQKYETLKIEVQEISLRTKKTLKSEVEFKQREIERIKISLKQISREETDANEELFSLKKIFEEKNKILTKKRQQEEELNKKFEEMLSEKERLQKKIREKETDTLSKKHAIHIIELEINEFKIEKARVDAEIENFETEMLEFSNVEIIKTNKDVLVERLAKSQEIISRVGTVNLRSLEVYDSIKKEYDVVKEKAGIIEKEKDNILKVIHEIDVKKKKSFIQTLKKINELFSRNLSQLIPKAEVFLELENNQNPFEPGSGVQIIVKTGHGKYFDVKSLSGGEQTLVALSLIFAIQEYRPYYFYLLDEIDAALDKRNSERLAGLLNKYMLNGQYIVITHNDEIISKATNLYGISMHDGISKIISLKV
ncbi:MAG: chromosome segregation SMC family protein [Nanoarchaeota archaeon]